MAPLTLLPPFRSLRRWLLGGGLALALIAPDDARAGSATAAISIGVEVRATCAVDTRHMTSVAIGANDVVVVRGALGLGCSGFASAQVTLSNRNAAREQVTSSQQPRLVLEESPRPTVQSITVEMASTDPDRDLVFVNVIF